MNSTTDQRQGETYHWVLTLQDDRGRIGTQDGHVNIHPSHTRMQTYTYLREYAATQLGIAKERAVVLYFDLAPMQFPAADTSEAKQ